MVDTIDPVRRSENMRRIRSVDTKPELRLRRLVYGMGFRYRLHRKDLPGHPDLVFAGRRKVIFVHGCFWHQHEKCIDGRTPRSKTEYWLPKLKRNVDRDASALMQLDQMGWGALVVWECQLSSAETIKQTAETVRRFLCEASPGR
jgi:DNA mismatch endonuclease (patch repair protein)